MTQHFFNSPFLLGFENLEKLLERTAKRRAKAIRPTISRRCPDGGIAITLAVAGFAERTSASRSRTTNW